MLRLLRCSIGHRSSLLIKDGVLSLDSGEVKGIVAPNGYGKTTLMRAASGDFTYIQKGAIEVDGVLYRESFCSPDVLYVPGDASHLYGHLSVMDHLKIAESMWGSNRSIDVCVHRCGVEGFMHKKVKKLSSGMKQQVALAIAYLIKPKYLLLDEPTNALDPVNAAKEIEIIEQMAREGSGVLVSSHLLGTIDALCGSVLFFRNGGIAEVQSDGDTSSVFSACYGAHCQVQG